MINRGFTLIELLVVIAIIGLLSSVTLASLESAREKGRDAKRASDVRHIQQALSLFYDDNGHYPISGGGGCGATNPNGPNGSWCNSAESRDANGHWIRTGNVDNLSAYFPSGDPVAPDQDNTPTFWNEYDDYFYYSNGRYYMLIVRFETANHPLTQVDNNDVTSCGGTNWGPYGPAAYTITYRSC